ncbi:MAG TPA: EamA family transporter [Verrucomicrobiales bacterium]|nr:EamA family transporter [Verrucomicrobiales bacterium]
MSSDNSSRPPAAGLIVAAFAAVYLIWGSTYLAIRYAVESMPPFLMAGSRFVLAGLVLFAWMKCRSGDWPTFRQWRDATIVGTLMLLGGNGGVVWAEKVIPSSVAALMVAIVPLWMMLLEWREGAAGRPTLKIVLGLVAGFAGVGILVMGGRGYDGAPLPWPGLAALLLATVCWAVGSLFSRRSAKPASALLAIGMQMISGGLVMTLFGVAVGEIPAFDPAAVSALSFWSWLYLSLVGALVGFTAYVWLLQVSTPSKVSTYAFVNPLIAVVLGCTLGREPFSMRLVFSTGLILVAVILIIYGRPARSRPATSPALPDPERAG